MDDPLLQLVGTWVGLHMKVCHWACAQQVWEMTAMIVGCARTPGREFPGLVFNGKTACALLLPTHSTVLDRGR